MQKFCLLTALSLTVAFTQMNAQVGIGTVTPVQKLDVNGAIKIGTTTTTSKGSIKYTQQDSSFEAYDNTRWKSMINNFDVVGIDQYGEPPYFSSMIRNEFVNLPDLTYTVKKSGYYLVLLSAYGSGSQERNDIRDFTDNRNDIDGDIRLTQGNITYLKRKFFYGLVDAADPNQDAPMKYHFDDGEKSVIFYFTAGDIIQANVFVQQSVGTNAPEQQNPWDIHAQVKYILLY
jgi:hypothetical protein